MDFIQEYMPAIIVDDLTITHDEDCLYLSVYTSNPSKTANLPVSVLLRL